MKEKKRDNPSKNWMNSISHSVALIYAAAR